MTAVISGDGSPSQLADELTPLISCAQSSAPEVAFEAEDVTFSDEGEQQKRRHDDDIHGLRISHSRLLLGLALAWIFVILAVVLLQGFGQWFTPFSIGFIHLAFELSDAVVIAFITSTTATVLGLYGIAAYWLYGRSKKSEVIADKSIKA